MAPLESLDEEGCAYFGFVTLRLKWRGDAEYEYFLY
jgi:hypothetical protein